MAVKVKRSIVKIDEEKCNGGGLCVPSCAAEVRYKLSTVRQSLSARYIVTDWEPVWVNVPREQSQ